MSADAELQTRCISEPAFSNGYLHEKTGFPFPGTLFESHCFADTYFASFTRRTALA